VRGEPCTGAEFAEAAQAAMAGRGDDDVEQPEPAELGVKPPPKRFRVTQPLMSARRGARVKWAALQIVH
jgi:hypothetical protein